MNRTISLRSYVTWSLAAAVGLLALGVFVLWITTGDESSIGTVGREIGAVLVTSAFLIGLYEPYLRKQVVRDVFTATDLSGDMAEVGLANVVIGLPEWDKYLADKGRITVLPDNPLAWTTSGIWAAILDRARQAKVDVFLYLPNWNDDTTLAALARQLDVADKDHLKRSLERVYDSAINSWQVLEPSRALVRGAKLSPLLYRGVTGTGLVIGDKTAIVTLPGSYKADPGELPVTLTFELESSPSTERWMTGLLAGLGAVPNAPIRAK